MRDQFRPEFLNRIDETIMFHTLTQKELTHIVDLQLQDVTKRLAEKRIVVTFSDKAKKLIIEKGYDPAYGARPLKRAIQDLVLDELALKIVDGTFAEGDAIQVDAKAGKIVLAK